MSSALSHSCYIWLGRGVKKMNVRSPNFSIWLCNQKRKYKFKWSEIANYLQVSSQCIDSYANGRAHPQLMRFYGLCAFIAKKTDRDVNTVTLQALEYIKKDFECKYL